MRLEPQLLRSSNTHTLVHGQDRCASGGLAMISRTYKARNIEPEDRANYARFAQNARDRGDFEQAADYEKAVADWEKEQGQERERLACPVCGDAFLVPTSRATSRPHRRSGSDQLSWEKARLLRKEIRTLQDELDRTVLCHDGKFNSLLDGFGIHVTGHRLVTRDGAREFELPDDILRDQAHPLLDGVKSLFLDQPTLIHYTGRGEPMVVLPDSSWAVDSGDWRVELGKRKRACAAIWSRSSASSLQVVVIAASVLAKNLVEKNRTFATNLVRWLSGQVWRSDTSNEVAWRDIGAIEVMLFELIRPSLQAKFGDRWWPDVVPLHVRKEASAREEEEGDNAPRETYADLLDLREVIHKNWGLFADKLDAKHDGKDRALKWIEAVNRIRRRMAHSVRARIQPATTAELSLLAEYRSFMEWISRADMAS